MSKRDKSWVLKAWDMLISGDKSQRQVARELEVPESTLRYNLEKVRNKDIDLLNGINDIEILQAGQLPYRMLFGDIETAPIKCYAWGIWQQNVSLGQIIRDWYVLCWSAKWAGSSSIMNSSVHHHGNTDDNFMSNEKLVVEAFWKLLDEADIFVAYNGKKFDAKKMNFKFYQYGLPEPSPYRIVDPMLTWKGNFAATSNKLAFALSVRHESEKMPTNFQLWIDCMEGKVEQLDYMQHYCDQDIVTLEQIYLATRAWDKNHPNLALYYKDEKMRCNCCGSSDLNRIDDSRFNTSLSSFGTYRCNNCGKVLRDRDTRLNKSKRKTLLMNVPR